MARSAQRDEWHWLNRGPRLQELMERYPEVWKEAGQELVSALEDGQAQKLNTLASQAKAAVDLWHHKIQRSRQNSKVIETAIPVIVRSRMFLLALEKCYQAAATGQASGKIRFHLVNGLIIQKLLFSSHLTRKPVSLGWFRFWWRFIGQKRLLMPLVQPKGIYCFYSGRLIRELARLIAGRSCLEIAAGDGTLARFLSAEGVRITATDDYSWKHAITYPDEVQPLDARQALDKFEPQVVLCSWPPAANRFERLVFAAKKVELYIVIGSRYRFASGNWGDYTSQVRFEMTPDPDLSRYVLPPELESLVLRFHRKE
jgi:hypothetical protein